MESTTLAAVLGFGQLGIVNRAIGLANLACGKLSSQLTYAIYPVLTRLSKESGQAERAGNLVLRLVAWSAIPLAVCLGWLAQPVVDTTYGPQWGAVIPLVKYTLGFAVASSLSQVMYTLVLSRSRERVCLACDMGAFIGTGASLVFALPLGIESYLIVLMSIQLLIIAVLTITLLREQAMTLRGAMQAISAPAISSLIALVLAHLITQETIGAPNTFTTAAIWGCLFGLIYILGLRIVFSGASGGINRLLPRQASVLSHAHVEDRLVVKAKIYGKKIGRASS